MFQSAHSLIADAEDLRKRRARNAMDAVHRTQLAMADANLEDAGRWIARAYRLAPDDSTVQLLFASIVVHSDPAKALAVLDALLLRAPWHREAAMARCAALLRKGQAETAARALGHWLRRMSPPSTVMFARLADAVCAANGLPGWIAMDGDGQCRVSLAAERALPFRSRDVRFAVDGQPAGSIRVRPDRLAIYPSREAWQHGHALTATAGGQALLGSGLDPSAFSLVDGFASATPDGAVEGWARLSSGSEAPPSIFLRLPILLRLNGCSLPSIAVTPQSRDDSDGGEDWQGSRWRFHATRDELRSAEVAEIVGLNGRNLWGSPVLLAGERRATAIAARNLAHPASASSNETDRFRPLPVSLLPSPLAGRCRQPGRKPPCDVVVPVYCGLAELDCCLRSLRDTLPRSSRLVLVNDGSPDPAISARLAA